jgi:hypothetical protein
MTALSVKLTENEKKFSATSSLVFSGDIREGNGCDMRFFSQVVASDRTRLWNAL